MNYRLFLFLGLLGLLLTSCVVNIDSKPVTSAPDIKRVTMNGQTYTNSTVDGQPQEQVASSADDTFVIRARAEDFSSVVIQVLRGEEGQKTVFASTTCYPSDGTLCELMLPTGVQWDTADVGYYDVIVKAINNNSTTIQNFPKWLLVYLE